MWPQEQAVAEARHRLEALAARVVGDDADLAAGWRVYRRFLAEPVRCAEDTAWVYVGPDPRDGASYVVRLGRRFEINDDDKYYDHTENVLLLFVGPADASTDPPRLSRMNGVPSEWAAFLDGVERDAAFRSALARGPWRCTVGWSR